jgi:ankyrin repeat protein
LLFSGSEVVFTHVFVLLFLRQITPLHSSSYCGHLETCRLLVESNADVTLRRKYIYCNRTKAQDKHDDSALQLAIRQGKADVVAYLRSIGAPE